MRYYSKRYKCAKTKQLKIAKLRMRLVRRILKHATIRQTQRMLIDSNYPEAVRSGLSSALFFYDFGA